MAKKENSSKGKVTRMPSSKPIKGTSVAAKTAPEQKKSARKR